ncbi:MAG: HEAT repeat domain-containing protein [Planctomycetota bacterium]
MAKTIIISSIVFFLLFQTVLAAPLRTAELTAAEQEQIKTHGEEILKPDRNQFQIYKSAEQLVKINHVKAAERLIEITKAASPTAKKAIITLIGDMRESGVVNNITTYWSIIEQCLSSNDADINTETIKTLTKLECPEISERLLSIIKTPETPKEKAQIVYTALATSRIRSMESMGFLIEALDYINEDKFRQSIIKTLNDRTNNTFTTKDDWRKWWESNKQKMWDEILQEIQNRSDTARRDAEKKLEAARKLLIERTIELLKALLNDPNQKPLFVARCIALLQGQDEEPEIKAWCATKLGELKVKEAVNPLIAALPAPTQIVRMAVIKALGDIADPAALDALIKQLDSELPLERAAVAAALGKLQLPKTAEVIISKLGTEKELSVLLAMVNALGDIGYEAAIPSLSALVVTPQGDSVIIKETQVVEIRRGVAAALKKLFPSERQTDKTPALKEQAAKTLIALLDDKDDSVRYQAADSLGEVKAASAIDKLCSMLETDPNPGVKAAAAKALGGIGDTQQKVLDSLYAQTKNTSQEIRKTALFSLRQLFGLAGAAPIKPSIISDIASKLYSEKEYATIKDLFLGDMDPKKLEPLSQEDKDKYFTSRTLLARSYMELKEFKQAIVEFESVVANFASRLGTTQVLYRKELIAAYEQDSQFSKALEHCDALLKSNIAPEQANELWLKKKNLIENIGSKDLREALRQINASLAPEFSPKPPDAVKKRLEELKNEYQSKLPKEDKKP